MKALKFSVMAVCAVMCGQAMALTAAQNAARYNRTVASRTPAVVAPAAKPVVAPATTPAPKYPVVTYGNVIYGGTVLSTGVAVGSN